MIHATAASEASTLFMRAFADVAAPSAAAQPLSRMALVGLFALGSLVVVAWARWLRPANLALGLATTVAMWTLSYIALMQPGQLAGEVLFAGVLACLFAGGFVAGRFPHAGARGAAVGLVSATVNLMVLGAFMRDEQGGSQLRPVLYLVGLFATSALLGWLGQRVGGRTPSTRQLPPPAHLLGIVATVNIFVMIVLGGLVTSLEAGLAVPDWPNSFGHNMLLYPISEMKGGIFYEHSHRLFGMLVGVVVLAFATTAWRGERRPLLRGLATALVAAVVVQGVLGGLRVTGNATTSMDAADLAPSTTLAIVHGMLGQFVFALAMLAAVVASRAWEGARPVVAPRAVRSLPLIAAGALVVQLFLGASMRHLQVPPTADTGAKIPAWAMHGHITMAIIAFVLVLLAGIRCGAQTEVRALRRSGKSVIHTVGLQFALGILALVAVLVRRGAEIPWWEVTSTTAHQAVGALLFALTVTLAALALRTTRAA